MNTVSNAKPFSFLKVVFLPITILLVVFIGKISYMLFLKPILPLSISKGIDVAIFTLMAIMVTLLIQRITSGLISWYSINVAEKTASRLDEELVPFLRRTASIIIWTFSILIILPFYGINTSALITVIGVGSLAISLAAKDTISNIIAGFLIMIDRPFRIDDKIKLPSGEVVKVIDIGIRRSKFQADDASVIIVPNLDLSKSKIINYTYGDETKS